MTGRFSVMVLDDEKEIVDMLERALGKEYVLSGFSEVESARQFLAANNVDVLLLDYRLGEDNGLDLLDEFKAAYPDLEVILITGYGDIDMAVRAVKGGAFHFLSKPFELEVVRHLVKQALFRRESILKLESLRGQVAEKYRMENLIGSSAKSMNLKEVVRRAQEVETDLLITGEGGVGKEFIARIVHTGSRRSEQPFISVSCSTLSADGLMRELLGAAKAEGKNGRKGALEAAGDGTLFLSDVFSIPEEVFEQVTEIIKSRMYRPAGADKPVHLEARIMVSCSKSEEDILAMDEKARELYRQLCEFPMLISPLRERVADIKDLAEFFLRKNGEKLGKEFSGFSEEAIRKLESYTWPGNVRHLENVVERVSIMEEGNEITTKYLPEEIQDNILMGDGGGEAQSSYRQYMNVVNSYAATRYLKDVLKKTDGNVTKASSIAGMKRESFHRLLKKHKIKSKDLPTA